MNNYFVILAAGNSKRFYKKIPTQFFSYRNKQIIDQSVEKSLNSKLFKKIIVVINKSHKKYIKLINKKNIKIIFGGAERHISSHAALKFLKRFKIDKRISK